MSGLYVFKILWGIITIYICGLLFSYIRCFGGYKVMYHIVPDIGFSDYIVVHWDCHGVVRLVLPNSHILIPRP